MTELRYKKIVERQMSCSEKKKKCHSMIDTSFELLDTKNQVNHFMKALSFRS